MAKDNTALIIGAGLIVVGAIVYFVLTPPTPPTPPPGEVSAIINNFTITAT